MAVSPRIVEGNVIVPKGTRFGIVASRFNHFIVDRLVDGALDALVRHGAEEGNITVVRVPGAWEVPVAVQRLARGTTGAKTAKLDAIIALAAVIRGRSSRPRSRRCPGPPARTSARPCG